MHPFLRSPKYMLILGLIWSPIVISIIALQSRFSGLSWPDSALLTAPPMILELFICLSLWYLCKMTPLDIRNIANILVRHGISAAIMNAVWLMLTILYSEMLDSLLNVQIWRDRFDQAMPLLLAVGFFLYFIASLFYYLILGMEKIRKAEQQALKNHLIASRAELKSLKSTIHPHFLFNSLNALSALTQTSPKLAQKVCIQLSDFMRYSLKYSEEDTVTIKDELEHILNYLGVEQIRFGDRLKLDLNVDQQALEVETLPFSLLPLVENAVKHGIQQCLEGGALNINIKMDSQFLLIEVLNPYDPLSHPAHGEGHGLQALMKRIEAVYGNNAKLQFDKTDTTFTVKLYIPT